MSDSEMTEIESSDLLESEIIPQKRERSNSRTPDVIDSLRRPSVVALEEENEANNEKPNQFTGKKLLEIPVPSVDFFAPQWMFKKNPEPDSVDEIVQDDLPQEEIIVSRTRTMVDGRPMTPEELTVITTMPTPEVVSPKTFGPFDPPEAVMPVAAHAEEYNMNHKRRGKAVIFNHEKFGPNVASRDGTNVDAERLENTFKNLGFEVIIYQDLKYMALHTVLIDLSQEDHTDCDCLVVVLMTHGLAGNMVYASDHVYPINTLWDTFSAGNALTLAGKPKLFFIQACRGENLDKGVMLQSRSMTQTDSAGQAYQIPSFADFLIANSSFDGHYSFRNPDTGTWYIQCLCDVLQEEHRSKDLLKILTITSRKVAIDHASYDDQNPLFNNQKQIPTVYSMLIRDVYFRPKK